MIRVALIDDDSDVLDALSLYLTSEGFQVAAYSDVTTYLQDTARDSDIIVSDVRMPNLTGIELQQRLIDTDDSTPLILITGHGDIEMAVSAVKAGAHDFIEKPFDESRLKQEILTAVSAHRRRSLEREQMAEITARVSELSQRQQQVMRLAVKGATNKEIAAALGISPRTVEDYRAWVMQKLGAKNLAELVRLVTWAEAKSHDNS